MGNRAWRPKGWKNPYPGYLDTESWNIGSLTHGAFEDGANAMIPFVLKELGARLERYMGIEDTWIILKREFIETLLRGEMPRCNK